MENAKKISTVRTVYIALMAALLCVISPWSIYISGIVPISLATFAIYLAGALLKPLDSLFSVIVYILIGTIGLPVFSSFQGGIHRLIGATGGYIIGYLPCVLIISVFCQVFKYKAWSYPVGMIIGTVVLYAAGTAWYIIYTGSPIYAALGACVFPFIPGDVIKIAAACVVSVLVKPKLAKIYK